MTCKRVDQLRAERPDIPSSAWPDEARRHLSECAPCAALQGGLDGLISPPDTAALNERVKAALLPELSAVRPLAPVSRFVAALLCSAAILVILANLGLGAKGWHARSALQFFLDFTLLAAGLLLLAVLQAHRMSPGSSTRAASPIHVAAPLVALLASCTLVFGDLARPDFRQISLSCWLIGIACAALSAPVYLFILRRGVFLNRALYGAAVGLFSGLTGVIVLEIYCPYLDRSHIFLSHLGSGLTALLAGALLGAIGSRAEPSNESGS